MKTNQKDIVLVPYPFSDAAERKIRPALIVSNDSFNRQSIDYVLVPLTSVLKSAPYSVNIDQEDLSSGKLIVKSRVRTDKLLALDRKLIIMKIGTLSDETFLKVKRAILTLF